MLAADLVIQGTVLTVDELQPTAEALAVSDGRIIAVGERADVESWIGPGTEVIDTGDGCVMPGFVEAHGHPLMEAIVLSDRMVDIRPVTIRRADDVVDAIRREVANRGADGGYLNGWDPLLQNGLPEPTLNWLNAIAPDSPLVIIHNSGHKAYFNSAAGARAGLTRDTADPKGARYGRDADGELDGTAEETGAVFSLLAGAIDPSDYPAMLRAECARLNRGGLTTCSEMAFDPLFRPVLEQMRDALTVRLRTYEISNAQMTTDMTPDNGDDMVRQVGIKIWVDGSPWIGNIDLSLPVSGHRRHAHHRRRTGFVRSCQLHPRAAGRDRRGVLPAGLADGLPRAGRRGRRHHPRRLRGRTAALAPATDHRLRLEHVGAIRPEQLQRAHDLGVTCSLFVDQIHYWGDVIVDGLFGPEHGERWMPCGSRRHDRDADLAAQRPAGHAGRAAAQHQRRCHQDRAERPRAGPRGAADGRRRPSVRRPSTRRGSCSPTTWSARWRSASTPTWWCCRPIRAPCRRRRSPISRCARRFSRASRFTRNSD